MRIPITTALAALAASAIVVSLVERTPAPLPAVTLGSVVLLHAERAAVLFGLGLLVITVLVRASGGRLPDQLSTSGLAYESAAASGLADALAELQAQVVRIERDVTAMGERIDDGGHGV